METAKKQFSKGKKTAIVVCAVIAALIAAILLYGFVFTKTGYWLVAKLTPDTKEMKLTFSSATDTTRMIGDEAIVLMQNNDNLLPLTTSKENPQGINIFGMRGIQLVYNAGGSAASDVSYCTKLADALTGDQGNFAVNDELLYLYYNYFKNGKTSISKTAAPSNISDSNIIETGYNNLILPELPVEALTNTKLYSDRRTVLEHAKDFSDVALVVLGRGAGELFDYTPDQLQLQPDEKALLDAVCGSFDKVILVLNSANALELDFINDYPSIKSVLWMGYPGQDGVTSLVRVLNGTVNPSGHLVDTWLKNNLASPAAMHYFERQPDGSYGLHTETSASPNSRDSYHYQGAPDGQGFFAQYGEGIYVGYKYFETRHDTDPSYNYDADVMYPFGHGLSYTTFNKRILAMNEDDGVITVRVEVKNTGDTAGKDTIQIYYAPPYTGAIEKSSVNLVAFHKTNLIQPGDTEVYSLSIKTEDMASYDDKVNKSYVLEKGEYEIMLRENAHTQIDSEVWKLDHDVIYNDAHDGKRESDLQVATNRFDEALAGYDDFLTRSWDPTSRAFAGPKEEDFIPTEKILDIINNGYYVPTDAELGLTQADMPAVGVTLDKTIMLSDMVGVDYDDPKWDEFVSQMTMEEMCNLSGNAGYHIEELTRLGIPRTYSPDGPAGIGTSIYSGPAMGYEGNGVTYPCAMALASTWNEELAHLMGTSVGEEARSIGFTGWYAPAMNTHRTPFNGRNFEYYSEDGVLAGCIAKNVVRGVTDKGVACFIKHFAVNDRESNDRYQLFTWCSEQAMREIYLKPFEMAVKEGGSIGVMSAFNYIGTDWCGASYGLLTEVLRNEWGFRGAVVSDAALYGYMKPTPGLYAGQDMSLDMLRSMLGVPGHAGTLEEDAKDTTRQIGFTQNLHQACKNICYTVAQTWKVAGIN